MLRAVIFDFDLTLADSTAGAIDCINHALQCLGLPNAPDRRILESIGLSLPDTFAYITGKTDPPMVEAFARHFVARADEVMADLTVLYECVPPVVRTLQAAGVAQGIVSSKFRYRIERIVAREQLVDCFPVIVGAEDTPYHKPHPAGLLQAMSRLGCQPDEVVYIGDHPVDAQAARGAGISFVAVLTGMSERQDFLENQPPLAIIDNLTGLPELLGVVRPCGQVMGVPTLSRVGPR